LSVRRSGDCADSPDRLTVRDGADAAASTPGVVLAVLCGTRNAETVTSSAQELTVELATDAGRQRQGFAAAFSFVDAASVTPPRRPTSTTTGGDDDAGGGGLGGWSSFTSNAGGQIHVPDPSGTVLLPTAISGKVKQSVASVRQSLCPFVSTV